MSTVDVIRLTISHHCVPLARILVQSCNGPPTRALIWSVQRMGDRPRGLVPSTLRCTTSRVDKRCRDVLLLLVIGEKVR